MKRRTAVKMVALGALASGPLLAGLPAARVAAAAGEDGSGRLHFFTLEENALADQLMERIIPADAHSPGAHAARVSRFADWMLATGSRSARRQWRQGLRLLRQEAARSSPAAALAKAAANEAHPRTALEKFFAALKSMTINGYYTSSIGIHQDLQYQGNTYLGSFPGCTIRRLARISQIAPAPSCRGTADS